MKKPCLLDSDTLSELSRGNAKVAGQARIYLQEHGRLSFSAITCFERLRGYRAAIAQGKPFEPQLESFMGLCQLSRILPVDQWVADTAAAYWAQLGAKARRSLGDILIAATAASHEMTLVTRNRKDFAPILKLDRTLDIVDWTR